LECRQRDADISRLTGSQELVETELKQQILQKDANLVELQQKYSAATTELQELKSELEETKRQLQHLTELQELKSELEEAKRELQHTHELVQRQEQEYQQLSHNVEEEISGREQVN